MTPVWRKSSRSNTQGHECLEVADLGARIGIRDSKDPQAGHLSVSRAELARLVGRVLAGELDLK